MKQIVIVVCAGLWAIVPVALPAAERGQRVVEATYRITDGQTGAACFLLERPRPGDQGSQLLLVTAAHVLENFKGEEAKVMLRRVKSPDEIETVPTPIRIRDKDQPLWKKHPDADVAAMLFSAPEGMRPSTLPVDLLATAETWKQQQFEPGDLVRLAGYPHGMQFEPNPLGYPTTRLGALAGFPLRPSPKARMFLIDCNIFEGDSGGPIYCFGEKPADGGPAPLILLGLLHGQHFLNEGFRTVYQTGEMRHRFGLGIVVHATAISETLELIPKE